MIPFDPRDYFHWLILVSLFFLVVERLRPARRGQKLVRPQLLVDAFYLVFNGKLYGLMAAGAAAWMATRTRAGLDLIAALPEKGLLAQQVFVMQFACYLLVRDFMEWCVHNLLHRVPFLWQFHKVHHSIHAMDWIGHFRFHWVESIVYRSLTYIPLLWLGGDYEPLLACWVFATFWGHFNHSNLDLGLGPLGFVFNSPRMHLWHHDASTEGGQAKNFGLVFSLWDYVFGTAYWPRDRPPARIGYEGDGEMPRDVIRQLVFPAARGRT